MEAMEAESEGKIHISPDVRVHQRWKIPRSTRKMRGRRKRSQFFKVHAGDALYYTGSMFYVNVRLAIDPSLAKISGADLRLASSTSDYYTMI